MNEVPIADVSIVIPTFNRADVLEVNSEYIDKLDPAPREVIVIDDGSDTENRNKLLQLTRRLGWKLLGDGENRGQAGARNKGLQFASSKYIVSLDDDSWFVESDSLSRVEKLMEDYPGCGVLAFRTFSPGDEVKDEPELIEVVSDHITCGAAYRGSAIKVTGGHLEFLRYEGEESDISLKMINHGFSLIRTSSIRVFHDYNPLKRSPESISRTRRFSVRNEISRAVIYFPFPINFFLVLVRIASQTIFGLRRGFMQETVGGTLAFIRLLPRLLRERRTISFYAAMRYLRLRRNPVRIDTEKLTDVVVSNAGTIRVFQISELLNKSGVDAVCFTTIYVSDTSLDWLPGVSLKKALVRRLQNRSSATLKDRVQTHGVFDYLFILLSRIGIGDSAQMIEIRNRDFGRWASIQVPPSAKVIWSFDTASCELFENAHNRTKVLDVSIAHPAICESIVQDYKDVLARLDMKCSENLLPDKRFMERRTKELELADHCLVGSEFVRDSLLESNVPADKISILPYGVDTSLFGQPRAERDDKFRFLFAGIFGHRKGLYLLLKVWQRMALGSEYELRLVGGRRRDLSDWVGALPPGVVILGKMTQRELAQEMADADVFVFPSLFEGFAKVVLEAMASGLPVLTTTSACQGVEEGESGWIIPPADIEALENRLLNITQGKFDLHAMSDEAKNTAKTMSWEKYGRSCADLCRELTGQFK